MAEELTAKDVIRAHARDELGIDVDDMTNPYQAAAASAIAFIIGAGIPLLAAAFIPEAKWRILSVVNPVLSYPMSVVSAIRIKSI